MASVYIKNKATGFESKITKGEWDAYPSEAKEDYDKLPSPKVRAKAAREKFLADSQRYDEALKSEGYEAVETGGEAPPVLVLTPPNEEK